jgi:hypothetical protein
MNYKTDKTSLKSDQKELMKKELELNRKQTADPTLGRPRNLDSHAKYDEYVDDYPEEIKEEVTPDKSNDITDDSADLDRASDNDDILESHLNRNDRDKIKELFDIVNNDKEVLDELKEQKVAKADTAKKEEKAKQDQDNEHKRHPMFENPTNPTHSDGSADLDRESDGDDNSEYTVEEVDIVSISYV